MIKLFKRIPFNFPSLGIVGFATSSHLLAEYKNSKDNTTSRNTINNNFSIILDNLFRLSLHNKHTSNNECQIAMENQILDQFNIINKTSKGYSINGIVLDSIPKELKQVLIDKNGAITNSCIRLIEYYNNEHDLSNIDKLIGIILNKVSVEFLVNLCLLHFLLIAANQNTDDTSNFYSLSVAIKIAKKIISRYIFTLKVEDNNKLTIKEFYPKISSSDRELIEDETFKTRLGAKLIDILVHHNLISIKTVTSSYKTKNNILTVDNKYISSNKRLLISIPTKLPMIVTPKEYNEKSLGGYLLNGVKYSDNLLIDKHLFKEGSKIDDDNIVYSIANQLMKTSFKINKELLNYIIDNNDKHKFLLDTDNVHSYELLNVRTKSQEREITSYNSKVVLQETILSIASLYVNFPNIYFPVRLDQRGRIYCTSSYFNYQSNELSKALLLFSVAGTINKDDTSSIKYLEMYGANCFGKDKLSEENKIKWVESNKKDILNYDNGILLNKAKNKFLFLSFCMEYKRYTDFLASEIGSVFNTYLPIQLDATCNGFQHMALLSNEKTLFKQLNLEKASPKDKPKDFYSFLLHKLIVLFDEKISKTDTDKHVREIHKNLRSFIWERGHIKKAIMTIPYSVSTRNMINYIKQSLTKVSEDKLSEQDRKNKVNLYSASQSETKPYVSDEEITVLVDDIRVIIFDGFEKIKKLVKYLKNVATVLGYLELPIVWSLPHGLIVRQSYLKTESISIKPFLYNKSKVNIQIVNKDVYDKNKQVRALVANLIHSLDATSLSLLVDRFSKIYDNPQIFAIHDCFGTTLDKVDTLKTILASIYVDLYSNDHYLDKFDKYIIKHIKENVDNVSIHSRRITIKDSDIKQYILHDIDWVKNQRNVNINTVKKIDSQYIII